MRPVNTITWRKNSAGIYFHFPWCHLKCDYCDFYSLATAAAQPAKLAAAWRREMELRRKSFPKNTVFNTIHFGGGTPSIMPPEYIKSTIDSCRDIFNIPENSEITLEANPEDLSSEFIEAIHNAGINRLSVGVQSLQEKHLKTLGRYYNSEKYAFLAEVKNGPIGNFSFDLIHGIPGQTKEEFFADINTLISYGAGHLSLYSLTMEQGTPYYSKNQSGKAPSPDEELQTEILQELPAHMKKSGFNQYEVSNYCLPRHKSNHNMKYWTMEYYAGIGPGAHGFTPQGRYNNKRSVNEYLERKFSETFEPSDYFSELAMTLFRIFYPIDIDSFLQPVPEKREKLWELLHKYSEKNLSTIDDGIFRWKAEAVLHLDALILEIAGI